MSATKLILTLLFFFLLLHDRIPAQEKEPLNISIMITSKGADKSFELSENIKEGSPVEGYFIIPRYDQVPYDRIIPGGFNFLDDNIFGGYVPHLLNQWAENNFPVTDIERMTNGNDVMQALSFSIKPILNKKSSFYLAAKFAVFTAKKIKDDDLDQDYNVKLLYKFLPVNIDSVITLQFLNRLFPDYDFQIKISTQKKGRDTLTVDQTIFDAVKNSVKDAAINNTNFDLSAQISIIPADINKNPFSSWSDYLSFHKKSCLEKKYFIKNSEGNDLLKLSAPVYFVKFDFPFQLMNKEKDQQYKNYKSRDRIFQSSYEVILVPVSLNGDTLTVDIISSYKKITLNDGIERWSPFKKRITIKFMNTDYALDLPKENWSAVFTRDNDYYEIYGYSDYERFINEQLTISLQKIINGD